MNKVSERFEKAYESLVRAYHEGTLAKGTCAACAVSNIIADAVGEDIVVDSKGCFNVSWNVKFWTGLFLTGVDQSIYRTDGPNAEKLERLTGYNVLEMARVEYAFERNAKIQWGDYCSHTEQEILEDQYRGLEAVVNVLLEIENQQESGQLEKLRSHPKLQKVCQDTQ